MSDYGYTDPSTLIANYSGGGSSRGGVGSALGAIGSAAAAINPVLGVVGAVAGFFGASSERRRRRREARRRKLRAIKSENLLMGAAKNVREDFTTQSKFISDAFDIQQRGNVQSYGQTLDSARSSIGASGLARSGAADRSMSQIVSAFELEQQRNQLGLAQDRFQLDQQRESQLRDIQGNLIELSAYSGRNINILGAYQNNQGAM
jgi:hypothetical protein